MAYIQRKKADPRDQLAVMLLYYLLEYLVNNISGSIVQAFDIARDHSDLLQLHKTTYYAHLIRLLMADVRVSPFVKHVDAEMSLFEEAKLNIIKGNFAEGQELLNNLFHGDHPLLHVCKSS